MGWFEQQLRSRENADNADFEDAVDFIAKAVMGERLSKALESREIAESAIDEILHYYHCSPSKREPLPPEIRTASEQIEYRMRPLGILSRSVVLDKGWYRYAVGAMLGTLKESGEAVALIPGKFSGYRFLDIRTGKWTKLNRKTEQLLDKDAVCFYEPLPRKKLSVTSLLQFMFKQLNVSDISVYLVTMAAAAALGLLSPVLTKLLLGKVMASGSLRVLTALAVFMICYSLSRLCFTAFQTLTNARISIKQNIAVQAAIMNRIMSLPTSFFKDYASGDLAKRAAYAQSLCTTLWDTIGVTGLTSLFSLIYIGQIMFFTPILAVPALLITFVEVLIFLFTTFAQIQITRREMQLAAKADGLSYAIITGIPKIKLAGAEKRMFSRWAKLYAQEAETKYNPPLFLKLSSTVSLAISLFGTLIMYILAVKHSIGVADYYAFNASYGMVSAAFLSLASVATSIANIMPALEMAKPIMETEPEAADRGELVTTLDGAIELSHVSFRYNEKSVDVIDDLSLKVRPGEYLAVVGSTGCGKSTLVRLLLGFEKPQNGIIYYDGRDISELNLESLRKKIGVVMQNGHLFRGDIFSNIVISAPQLTLEDAWEAAEIASIADDIREMPMGMSTMISEGHGSISGGQKQRLMIARAVAHKPKVLIFDEATSALDNITQKKVSEAIDRLQCTRIVIAHRLSTIRHADRIIYLHDGKIVEDGTYEELLEKDGYFADLVARQRLDVEV